MQTEENLKFFWESVKEHLKLTGLKKVSRLYPEFREEAEKLAASKRPMRKSMEATAPMHQ